MIRSRLGLLMLVGAILLSGCGGSGSPTSSTPVRYVYVTSAGQPAGAAYAALPYVLSTLDARSGKLLWHFQPSHIGIITGPVTASDVAYVGADDHNVYALVASTGQVRWQAQTEGLPQVEAVVGDIVLVQASTITPTSSEDNVVYALGAANGKVIWHTDLQQGVVQAIDAGKIYVETNGQDTRILSALDVRSGQRLWQYQLGGSPDHWQLLDGQIYDLTSPTRDALTSVLFVVSGRTGKLLWRYPAAGEALIWPLAVAGRQVYLLHGSIGGQNATATLSAFDAATGTVRWEQSTPAATSLVAAGNGSVYISTPSDLMALRTQDGVQAWHSKVSPGAVGLVVRDAMIAPGAIYASMAGQGLVAFNASDGSQSWRFPVDDSARFELIGVSQRMLYAGIWSPPARPQVVALDTRTGKVVWSYDVGGTLGNLVAG